MPISEEMMMAADEIGIRLEMVEGLPVWEAHPVYRHQKAVDRIRASIKRPVGTDNRCDCIHVADLSMRFPDGSQKRPDIAIFCREPDEQEAEVTLLPEAVIEIISQDYEKKDLDVGVPFYLAQNVKDVVVFNPYTGKTTHYRQDGTTEYDSPVEITLECGCQCTV